jgi:DNA-binding NarL/FixJ family response regulator
MFVNQNTVQKIIQEEIKAVLSEQNDEDEMETAINSALEGIDGLTPEQKGQILGQVSAALRATART